MSDKTNQAYHVIEARIPVPHGQRSAQNKIIGGYEVEMEALREKLPAGSSFTDKVSNVRPDQAEGKPARKTMAEKIAEASALAVEEDRKKRAEAAAAALSNVDSTGQDRGEEKTEPKPAETEPKPAARQPHPGTRAA